MDDNSQIENFQPMKQPTMNINSFFFHSHCFLNYILVDFLQFVTFHPIHRMRSSPTLITVLHPLFQLLLIKTRSQRLLQGSVPQVNRSTTKPSTVGSTTMAEENIYNLIHIPMMDSKESLHSVKSMRTVYPGIKTCAIFTPKY